jgi:hypothetical protein
MAADSFKGALLGPQLYDKIKATIARVDGTPVGGIASQIPTDLSGDVAFSPKVFRVCTFTGSWAINSAKTVTFRGVTSTPNTVSATNLVCGLSPTGTCDITIAKDGTAWYMVQPNLTQQPGYSASGTQVLAIVSGTLKWIGTTACS